MARNPFADALQVSPVLWVQTEEDCITSWRGLGQPRGGRLLTVTSGGCTALSFAAAGAGSVISIDVNPSQSRVLELKVAALEALRVGEVRALFGIEGDLGSTAALYARVRPRLSTEAAGYWDANQDLFLRRRLVDAGAMQGVGTALRERSPNGRAALEAVFVATDLERQVELVRGEALGALRLVAELRQERAELFFGAEDGATDDQAVAECMRRAFVERVTAAAGRFFFRTSPWAAQMLLGQYWDGVYPPYLDDSAASGFSGLGNRIEIVTSDIGAGIKALPDQSLHGADLSNVGDLMGGKEHGQLLDALRRSLRSGARVVQRQLIQDEARPLGRGFRRLERLSGELTVSDKSLVYSGIVVDERE